MKHIMKNFKVKHGQCGNIIFSRAFSFESSKSFALMIAGFFAFDRALNLQKGLALFQISQKEKLFHLL